MKKEDNLLKNLTKEQLRSYESTVTKDCIKQENKILKTCFVSIGSLFMGAVISALTMFNPIALIVDAALITASFGAFLGCVHSTKKISKKLNKIREEINLREEQEQNPYTQMEMKFENFMKDHVKNYKQQMKQEKQEQNNVENNDLSI